MLFSTLGFSTLSRSPGAGTCSSPHPSALSTAPQAGGDPDDLFHGLTLPSQAYFLLCCCYTLLPPTAWNYCWQPEWPWPTGILISVMCPLKNRATLIFLFGDIVGHQLLFVYYSHSVFIARVSLPHIIITIFVLSNNKYFISNWKGE